MIQINKNKSNRCSHRHATMSLLVLVVFLLVSTTIAKGASRGGGGSSFSSGSSTYRGSSSSSFGSSGSRTPVRTYGGGYASTTNSRYQNSRPNNGYNNNLLYGAGGFYLGSSYRRNNYNNNNNNNNNNEDENYDQYFNRIENGCQLTGVESYRTIDNNATSIWTGCSEEWRYNVEVIDTGNQSSSISNFSFVSPPVELYVCSENDSCSACEDELNGENFDALTLEALNSTSGTYLIDCYIPKNLSVVNDTFDCINEECVFISEKYSSAGATASSKTLWTILAISGITVTFYSMLLCVLVPKTPQSSKEFPLLD